MKRGKRRKGRCPHPRTPPALARHHDPKVPSKAPPHRITTTKGENRPAKKGMCVKDGPGATKRGKTRRSPRSPEREKRGGMKRKMEREPERRIGGDRGGGGEARGPGKKGGGTPTEWKEECSHLVLIFRWPRLLPGVELTSFPGGPVDEWFPHDELTAPGLSFFVVDPNFSFSSLRWRSPPFPCVKYAL